MQKMGKEAEGKILSALNKVADHVNDGDAPNEAIIKAATAYALPPGHIRLMVNAYNTGRTTRQRLTGTDPLSKAATFELADAEQVLEQLYPVEVKSAAAQRQDAAVSPEYDRSPQFLRRRASLEKAARDLSSFGIEKRAEAPTPVEPPVKEAFFNDILFHRRKLETCRSELSAAKTELLHSFSKLADYFQQPGSHAFPDVEKVAALQHGAAGKAVFRHLATVRPSLVKQAATGRLIPADSEPFPQIAGIVNLSRELVDAEASLQKLAAHLDSQHAEVVRAHFPHRPSPLLEGLVEKQAMPVPLAGMTYFTALANTMRALHDSSAVKARQLADNQVQEFDLDLNNPRLRKQRQAAEVQVMLNDLLASDPQLQQHDPEAVVDAYNDIAETVPRVAGSKLLMQGLLRRRLDQGYLDPFDAQSLLKSETDLSTLNPAPPAKKPEKSDGTKGKAGPAPKDGDGDGKVNDGKKSEKSAPEKNSSPPAAKS